MCCLDLTLRVRKVSPIYWWWTTWWGFNPACSCCSSHCLQVAMYVIPSKEHLPRHGFPDLTRGQPSLGHPCVLKGFLRAIPWNSGGPGFSMILTLVPLGPLIWATASLSLFANSEFLVSGTVRVAVASLSWTRKLYQVSWLQLSVFCSCIRVSVNIHNFSYYCPVSLESVQLLFPLFSVDIQPISSEPSICLSGLALFSKGDLWSSL